MLKRFLIAIAALAIIGLLVTAGIFIAAFGILLLPLLLLVKNQPPSTPKQEAPEKPSGNVIEADFKRVD